MLIYHNLFICNVLPFVFVLEFFVYLFIHSVNRCPSVSNFFWLRPKAAPGPLWLIFISILCGGCGETPSRPKLLCGLLLLCGPNPFVSICVIRGLFFVLPVVSWVERFRV
jgi:hypothetical protein